MQRKLEQGFKNSSVVTHMHVDMYTQKRQA